MPTGFKHHLRKTFVYLYVMLQIVPTVYFMYFSSTTISFPVIFRWHKYIDDILWRLARRKVNNLDSDAPPLDCEQNDIIISTSDSPPSGFDNRSNNFQMETLNTVLGLYVCIHCMYATIL